MKIIKKGGALSMFFRKRSPGEILVFGFAAVILLGALILNLPVSSANGESPGFLNCLFTATSSVCVTGLIVVDTGTYWSLFGQIVIVLLIQVGGLGFMSLMTIIFVLAGKRITIKNRLLLQSSVNSERVQGVVKFTKYIVCSALIIEAVGALLLMIVFIPDYGVAKGIYFGIWHSISSFCNGGFDLLGDYQSFTRYVNNGLLTFTVCALIVLGGLGFAVTSELMNYRYTKRLSLHSKIVLLTTAILIVVGSVLFFIFENNNPKTMADLPWYGKIFASVYQSITPRTAGSNTISQSGMTSTSKLLTMILMFIGGSPGSTAGGVKTTSIALLFVILFTVLTARKDVTCFKRRLTLDAIKRAVSMVLIAISIILVVTMMLLVIEPDTDPVAIAFEVFSAYSTVGLTCDLTPTLHPLSKSILIIVMFIGRVGPLTIAYVITRKERKELENKGQFRLPEGNVLIG